MNKKNIYTTDEKQPQGGQPDFCTNKFRYLFNLINFKKRIITSYSNTAVLLKFRHAKQSDKNNVLRFCTNTFEWGNYIEQI